MAKSQVEIRRKGEMERRRQRGQGGEYCEHVRIIKFVRCNLEFKQRREVDISRLFVGKGVCLILTYKLFALIKIYKQRTNSKVIIGYKNRSVLL